MDQEKQTPKIGFYKPTYTLEEVADLVTLEIDKQLEDELTAVRVTIRRVLGKMDAELEPAEYARITSLVFQGATTIANLLRTRRAISGQAMDGFLGAIAQAIQELETERDWKL